MNKCTLIGRVTADIEVRKAGDKSVINFTLAVDRYKDSTDFINCVAWERRGETIAQYVHKGDRLAVAGRIQTRTYDDKDGNKRSVTEVLVEDFDLIQPRREDSEREAIKQQDDYFPVGDEFVPF